MKNNNKNSTRYYSDFQQERVCGIIDGKRTANSGASKFSVGDVINDCVSLVCECKTCMNDKQSFSIKKDWLEKIKSQAFAKRYENTCLAFNFGPGQKNYFVIDENLMRFLVEKLKENQT